MKEKISNNKINFLTNTLLDIDRNIRIRGECKEK
jgi:hypothetical protein